MKSAIDFLLSLTLLFGAGAMSIKAIEKLEAKAKLKIQKGLPHLSPFTTKLTGLKYDENGNVQIVKSKK